MVVFFTYCLPADRDPAMSEEKEFAYLTFMTSLIESPAIHRASLLGEGDALVLKGAHNYRCGFPFISFNACWIWVCLALLLSPPAGRVARTSGLQSCRTGWERWQQKGSRAGEPELDLLLDFTYCGTFWEGRNDLNSLIFQFNPFPWYFRNARGRTTIKMLNFDWCERNCAALLTTHSY